MEYEGSISFLSSICYTCRFDFRQRGYTPGKAIYQAVLPGTEAAAGYLVGGQVDAITAIIAVFNGVIYGFIAWLIFTILMMLFGKKEKKNNVNVNVTVNNNMPGNTPPPPPQ